MEIRGAKDEEERQQHPWLLIPQQKSKQIFYSISENRFHVTTNIPELSNNNVFASAFGWLVLVDIINNDLCCLWNPVSFHRIELPQLSLSSKHYNRCVLSKPPTEPNCHILFISSITSSQAFCQIGDDEFVIQKSNDHGGDMWLSTVVSFRGKIYGIDENLDTYFNYGFVTINFVGRTLQLNPILMIGGRIPWVMPHPSRPWASRCEDYLIESSSGELLLVHKMTPCIGIKDDLDFRVFHVDVDRMKCNELHNIGEEAIFISDNSDAFCSSAIRIKPNSIYYTVCGSRNLYRFDLDDRSTTESLPCAIAKRSNSQSYWVPQKSFRNFLINST